MSVDRLLIGLALLVDVAAIAWFAYQCGYVRGYNGCIDALESMLTQDRVDP